MLSRASLPFFSGDDTPIGAVSQYDNDDSSIARDEDVVLILKALSSTPGHIQASLDHATGLYRGPEIVTEFGSGANAAGSALPSLGPR